ncbi:SAM-dependent methyltransferase [Mycobacterium rhizamassiliense]|uniref:SAM-dependent methyltransferase n=1 Tax=Mycobacterium rhizamassiliense TaxID=1841860 RepID=A0A2U3NT15_9MYCO|nr:class I SAM-dependent methyltransferase [Mycobacterium rhizamassiliense]SPM34652.1 SAM-dependent methyltransferase [Mycobacterium rhizamassiliense]
MKRRGPLRLDPGSYMRQPRFSAGLAFGRLTLAFTTVSDRLTQIFAKRVYPLFTRRFADQVRLINLGYEEDPPMGLSLPQSDEPGRFMIQLYHRTAAQVDLTGKRVLEVSCGHGGGASHVVRTLGPASYTGLDLNRAGIDFCRAAYDLPGLSFVHGDAQSLPFSDDSFDAVLNVEASHGYPDFPGFLAEVARVLRPGGHFLYTDLRPLPWIAQWEAAFADVPMRVLSERCIDEEVSRGLIGTAQRLHDLVAGRGPRYVLDVIRYGMVVYGKATLGPRRSSYRMYCLAKDEGSVG